jgi:hypothetical protein
MESNGGGWRIAGALFGIVVGGVIGCLLGFPVFELVVRPILSDSSDNFLVVNPTGLFELVFTVTVTTVLGAIAGYLFVSRLKN